MATDIEEPNVGRFVEQHEFEEAVEAHSKAEHDETFADAVMPDLLAEEPQVAQFEGAERSE